MGLDPEAWLREQQKKSERWYRRTTADIEAAKRNVEQSGREIWNEGTRRGSAVVAQTQQQLQQIGKAAQRAAPRLAADIASGFTQDPNAREIAKAAPRSPREAREELAASLHGASDGATLGLGDRGSAAVRAGTPFTDGWHERYAANMQAERAQDAYDQQHYPIERGAGQVAGAVGSMAFTGPAMEAALGSRLVMGLSPKTAAFFRAAAATDREAPLARGIADHLRWSSYAGGTGAALGGGMQVVTDAAQGRLSSPKEVLAGMGGGAVDGVSTLYLGPARGGALGGAVTAATGDILDGRPPTIGHIAGDALAGYATGNLVGSLGKLRSQALPADYRFSKETLAAWRAAKAKRAAAGLPENKTPWLRDKGSLGDRLSETRSRLEFEGVAARQMKFDVSKSYTKADHVTKTGRPVEAKFGGKAELSPPQRLAVDELDGYRVDHFLPRDIGKLLALPITSLANPLFDALPGDRR